VGEEIGSAVLRRNPGALPRARVVGRPVYASDQRQAIAMLVSLGFRNQLADHVVVEDPSVPLSTTAIASGTARIVEDLPERVVIEADLKSPGYLVLADTYDPGWSATADGRPAAVRPAYAAFRAVYLDAGHHTVVFTYRPAGFTLGLWISACGAVLGLVLLVLPRRPMAPGPDHAPLLWPPWWRAAWFLALAAIVVASAPTTGPGQFRNRTRRPANDGGSTLNLPGRWWDSVHTFTWGAGEAARKENRQ
jgi:hypothetical protein